MLLKCLAAPGASADFLIAFDELRDGYFGGVTWEPRQDLEARAAALLPALFLARVDGKSPVEYVTRDEERDRVRRVAAPLVEAAPLTLAAVRDAWGREIGLG